MCTFAHTHTHKRTHTQAHTHTHTHTSAHTHTHTNAHTHTHTHKRAHTHSHTHKRTHTHTQALEEDTPGHFTKRNQYVNIYIWIFEGFHMADQASQI